MLLKYLSVKPLRHTDVTMTSLCVSNRRPSSGSVCRLPAVLPPQSDSLCGSAAWRPAGGLTQSSSPRTPAPGALELLLQPGQTPPTAVPSPEDTSNQVSPWYLVTFIQQVEVIGYCSALLFPWQLAHSCVSDITTFRMLTSFSCSSCGVSTCWRSWIRTTDRTRRTQAWSSTSRVLVCCSWSLTCRNWPITESESSPAHTETHSPATVSDQSEWVLPDGGPNTLCDIMFGNGNSFQWNVESKECLCWGEITKYWNYFISLNVPFLLPAAITTALWVKVNVFTVTKWFWNI